MQNVINRRSFIAASALASAGAVASATMPIGTSAHADEAAAPTTAEQFKNVWSFEVAPDPIPEGEIIETVTADVVVVGAGTAGLVTANSAVEEGLSVIVVSASSAAVSRGGSNNAVYSKAMEEAGYPKMDPWIIQKEVLANYNSVDQKKWYRYYNNSEEATNWMSGIMAEIGYVAALEQPNYIDPSNIYGQQVLSHSWVPSLDSDMVSHNQPDMVAHLAERLVEKGGTIYFGTRGLQLEREDNNTGRVTSVIAQNLETGEYRRFTGTKAVVLASGDFSRDRDMMYRYCPKYADLITDESYDGEIDYDAGMASGGLYRGDMHKAALWIGAAWQKTVPNCPMVGTKSAGATINRYQNFPGLLLDRNGERFMNEFASRALGPNTQSMQEGGVTYAIWDTGWADAFAFFNESYADQTKVQLTREEVIAGWDSKVEAGSAVKADTIEELIELAGLPASAVDTVNRYNAMCEDGLDTEFYKDVQYLVPVSVPPFYCEKKDYANIAFYTVLGGPRCNANCQVLDAQDNVIPGLYEVGTMIGDLFAGIYTFMVQGANYGIACLTFGYLTGKYIAANE